MGHFQFPSRARARARARRQNRFCSRNAFLGIENGLPPNDPFLAHFWPNFWTHFWTHFWTTFWPISGHPFYNEDYLKWVILGHHFGPIFGPLFDPFLDHFLAQKWAKNGSFRVSRGPGTKVEKRVKFSSRMSGSKSGPPSDSYCSGLVPLFGTRFLGVLPDFIG